MQRKRLFISVPVVLCLLLAIFLFPDNVNAIDFEGNEDQYMKTCSSSVLSKKDKQTCEEFNKYLKNKNKQLKAQIGNTKDNINKTNATIEDIQQEIDSINKDIKEKENEISYLDTDIERLSKSIAKKEAEIKERMYITQSDINSNVLIEFIFGAKDFTEMFSRIATINELTSYDKNLLKSLLAAKEEISNKRKDVLAFREVLDSQKESRLTLQDQHLAKLTEQNNDLKNQQQESQKVDAAQAKVDAALKQLIENAPSDNGASIVPNPVPATPKPSTPTPSKPTPSNPETGNDDNNQNTTDEENNNTDKQPSDDQNNNQSGSQSKPDPTPSNPDNTNAQLGNLIAQKALSKRGARYWWGAPGGGYGDGQGLNSASAKYFDCSGLVCWAHRQAGVSLGRTTAAGYSGSGKSVSYSQLQVGDVITFSYGSGVAHIGIYIGGGNMVHASGEGSTCRGQHSNHSVQTASVAPGSYWYNYIYNCRRLY